MADSIAPPIPSRLRTRPIFQGILVPFFVHVDEAGIPDFRVIDPDRTNEIVTRGLCGLCGRRLGQRKVFIGGPISTEQSHIFADPPAHEECARYALLACPYLSNPKAKHADRDQVAARHPGHDIHYRTDVASGRPERMAMYFTFSYVWNSRRRWYEAGPPIRLESF